MSFDFPEESNKLIQKAADALLNVEVGESEDDVLNELSISDNKNYIAFCCDSGTVGILDLSLQVVSTMKAKHSSICGCVKVIPNRPSEILSAGYDHTLYHFDFLQRKLLSVYNIPPHEGEAGVSLSPPFITSTALSANGLFAAGTADGRLFVGFGGEKASHQLRNKRSKKWEGLRDDQIVESRIAEGPVVSITFNGDAYITVSTLLGSITRLEILRDGTKGITLEGQWTFQTKDTAKVNSVVTTMDESRMLIGGLTKEGAGIIEIWNNTTA